MKKVIIIVFAAIVLLCACSQKTDSVSYVATPSDQIEQEFDAGKLVITKSHRQNADGVWECCGNTYQYRFELTGQAGDANLTYVVLSNRQDITLYEAMMASWLGSNTNDYFDPKEAVIVGFQK